MEQTSDKLRYGLIGYPVSHSYSAFMQNAAFKYLGINAEYELFQIPPKELDNFFKKTIVEKKLSGFNVTVPYKEKAVPYLNASVSPNVRMNQAVNTVRVEKDGSLSGVNTDGIGFCMDLKDHGFDVRRKNVSLIGAGGGAKSVATCVSGINPARLRIFDIDQSKAELLRRIVKDFFPSTNVETVETMDGLEIDRADLLINATPVGMKDSDPLLIDPGLLRKEVFVYDLIYNPGETKLLRAARQAGCITANGLGMLLYQGALAFEFWTGKVAPVDIMRRALLEQI